MVLKFHRKSCRIHLAFNLKLKYKLSLPSYYITILVDLGIGLLLTTVKIAQPHNSIKNKLKLELSFKNINNLLENLTCTLLCSWDNYNYIFLSILIYYEVQNSNNFCTKL